MCFGSTHACTITCINDVLNETALAAGNITGQHIIPACKIACAAGVPIDDVGVVQPIFGGIITPFTVSVVLELAVVSLLYLHYCCEGWNHD